MSKNKEKKENKKYTFLLNHKNVGCEVVVETASEDILSGCCYRAGDVLKLDAYGVAILESEKL